MMDNQRSVRLALQVIILAERHNTQNTGLVQGQQPANGFRRDGGIVIDKQPGEPAPEAAAVLVVEFRHHAFNRLAPTGTGHG